MSQFCVYYGHLSSCFHISGDDALSYLQSQMTIRLPAPEKKSWTYGLWLNEKGRIIADSYVYVQAPDSCLLWSLNCPADKLEVALRHNIVADDVVISNLYEDMRLTLLEGTGITEFLETFGAEVPKDHSFIETDHYFLCAGRESSKLSVLFIAPEEFQKELHKEIKTHSSGIEIRDIDHQHRHFLRIQAGVPAIPQDLGERNLPQEGGLDTNDVDFTKGCFPGQEIMASFRKTGKLNKVLCCFSLPNGECSGNPPGDIYSGNLSVGNLTSVAKDGDKIIGIGLVRLRSIDKKIHVLNESGGKVPITLLEIASEKGSRSSLD